ncbi:unnamed protein product [Linum tenue]|uniref:GDSL esterase/lipase n=1 Tax=Linum tenue TaxID=586396 RepID=A0AAV0LQ15_9ROSI|nr:unnamed protein product [Linum tenue]
MSSSSIPFSSFAIVGLILLFAAGPTSARIQIPANESVPAALVFGDSIVDTGNNNKILTSPARCNFPPYGRDFYGGVPTGRFSNGKVPSDFLGSSNRFNSSNSEFLFGSLKIGFPLFSFLGSGRAWD